MLCPPENNGTMMQSTVDRIFPLAGPEDLFLAASRGSWSSCGNIFRKYRRRPLSADGYPETQCPASGHDCSEKYGDKDCRPQIIKSVLFKVGKAASVAEKTDGLVLSVADSRLKQSLKTHIPVK